MCCPPNISITSTYFYKLLQNSTEIVVMITDLSVDYLWNIYCKNNTDSCRAHKVTVLDLSKFINVYNPLCPNIYNCARSKHQPFEVTIASVNVVNVVCSLLSYFSLIHGNPGLQS